MLDYLIHLDKKLFIFLNNLGSKPFDDIWLLITKQSNWIPFFIILLFILYKKLGTKKKFINRADLIGKINCFYEGFFALIW